MDLHRIKYLYITLLFACSSIPHSGFTQLEENVSGMTVKILLHCNCEHFRSDTDPLLLYNKVREAEAGILSTDYAVMYAGIGVSDIPNCYVLTNKNQYASILEIRDFSDFNAVLEEFSSESDTIQTKNQITNRFFWYLALFENQNFEYLYLSKPDYNSLDADIQSSLIYNVIYSESKAIKYNNRCIQLHVVKKEKTTKGHLKGKFRYYDELLKVCFDETGMITEVEYE